MYRISFLWFLLQVLLVTSGWAQTELGGIVNVYGQFTGQEDCTNTITVTNAEQFAPGMGLVIIQMGGANSVVSNNADFGTVSTYNGAGQYEYNRITEVVGNTLTLAFSLVGDYLVGETQVVGFQIQENATVTQTVTAPVWNGLMGGVIALEVNGTLTLNADVDASGRGFGGGRTDTPVNNNCNALTFANNYAYAPSDWRGAQKGAGITRLNSQDSHGRGAQANGGGGGNDHNSGGGGGANLVSGGRGGTNEEPSFFGCNGNFPGEGGKALDAFNGQRLFLGGGGGSGHSNNLPVAGGAGGGIVIIKASNLVFANGSIRADGRAATATEGDGGGGGGAGGTLLLLVENAVNNASVSADGGDGASVAHGGADRCFGPGGGGAGGAIWQSQNIGLPTSGGLAGRTLNSSACGEGTNGAQNGEIGPVGTLTNWNQGPEFVENGVLSVSPDQTACTSGNLVLFAEVGTPLDLGQWQFRPAADQAWTDLGEAGLSTNGQDSVFFTLPVVSDLQTGFYRYVPNGAFGCPVEPGAAIFVDVLLGATVNPTFTITENTVNFAANLSGEGTLEWQLAPGETSTEESPVYTFPGPGTYPVELSLTDICGTSTISLEVVIGEPIQASILTSSSSGCAPLSVLFEDNSDGNVTSRNWTFPGGNPVASEAVNPLVVFTEPGMYTVTLSVNNGTTESSSEQVIEVMEAPVASFTFQADLLTVGFENTSTGATTYLWNFGDGSTSTAENPVHTYAAAGNYEVTLSASNSSCGQAISQSIPIVASSATTVVRPELVLFPNPGKDWLRVNTRDEVFLSFWTPGGQLLHTAITNAVRPQVYTQSLPAGLYLVQLRRRGVSQWVRWVKAR
ncbi:MAG: PKD domain-containing protein [Bacteroidota bacterium]